MHRSLLIVALIMFAADAFAAQIYFCKLGNGGSYWSANWCNQSGGFTVDAVTVPDGLPFQSQVDFAQGIQNSKATAQASEAKAVVTATECRNIDSDLGSIWSRYKNGDFVDFPLVDTDQVRWKQLKERGKKLGCELHY